MTLAGVEADNGPLALQGHCRRAGVVAVEVAKHIGWSVERQTALRRAAGTHHQRASLLDAGFLSRLIRGVWGDEAGETEIDRGLTNDMAKLLELCCFFVERWEYGPFEMTVFPKIIEELRTLAGDGFLDAAHVEALAVIPHVTLRQVQRLVSTLPVFPIVALRAMDVAANPLEGVARIEEMMEDDPLLANEILAAFRSASGRPGTAIVSAAEAVLQMGLDECCRVLIAAALRPLFKSPLARPLWNHSLKMARAAESLARQTGKADPNEAFLAGLLHDVGRLALLELPTVPAARYAFLLDLGCEPVFAETLLCGFDHTVAGREVMRHWGLAGPLAAAVEFHHQPERCHAGLVQVVYMAEHTSGSDEDMPSAARLQLALRQLGLENGVVATL